MAVRFTTRWLFFAVFIVAATLTAALVVPPYVILSVVLFASWSGVTLWLWLLIRERP